MKIKITLLFLLLTKTLFAQKAQIAMLPNLPYDKYTLKTEQDSITFYLSVTALKSEAPLIIFVQGSGMNSLFTKAPNGRIRPEYGHMTWYDAIKEKCRILVVEKPGVQYLQSGPSRAFDEKFSLESFSNTIVAAINYVTEHEKIDKSKILLTGHSEGGIVAARVANLMQDKISHVAILAGEGPSQLYSLYKFAGDGTFFNTKEHNMPTAEQRIHYVTEKWKDILADPNSVAKKFWGFTYLRWSSMLRTSVMEELSHYNGNILLVQGSADKAVYPETAIFSYTALLSKGKKVTLDLVANADHSFNIADKPDLDGWKFVLENVNEWFTKTAD